MNQCTLYLSGPITGISDYRERFDREAKRFIGAGWAVVNPATLDLGPGATWEAYMKVCIPMLCPCDEIFMLEGWEASDGAKEERRIAKMLGIPVSYAVERQAAFARAFVANQRSH